MKLIIAEKPVLGESIAAAIPGNGTKNDGTITKGDWTVVWCFGHLMTLADPEDYDESYKKWSLEQLPIYFDDWKMKVKPETSARKGGISLKARVKQIFDLMDKAEFVVNAGDMDEEGQRLVDELLEYHKYPISKVYRLDTSDTSVNAMKKALNNLKPDKDFYNFGLSAYGREIADMVFGYNLSRYYTLINHTKLTVGRVQTATLGLVVNRDNLIESFSKAYYYEVYEKISLKGQDIILKYCPDKDDVMLSDGKILNRQTAEDIVKRLSNKTAEFSVTSQIKKENPPLPFNLKELNTFCNRKFGYNPSQVMNITQQLREKYKAITYNRSDCQYLSEEHFKEAPGVIASVVANFNGKYDRSSFDTTIHSKCFNDKNITAHFAIIPTDTMVNPDAMTKDERNVYTAICERYLIQFMPSVERVVYEICSDKLPDTISGVLKASCSKIQSEGYLALYYDSEKAAEGDEVQNNDMLVSVLSSYPGGSVGDLEILDGTVKEKETKPPQRYNQTTLYNDMSSISKYVTDPEIKKILLDKDKDKKGENGSIGTSATRALIIQKLIDNGYLKEMTEKKKPYLISTDKAREFYKILPDNIKDASVTARWYIIQEEIVEGNASPDSLGKSVLDEVVKVIDSKQGKMKGNFGMDSEIICECPHCGGNIINGKYGPYCKEKCGFYAPSYFRGRKLTEKQQIDLLKGSTIKNLSFTSKNGKIYKMNVFATGELSEFKKKDGSTGYSLELDGEYVNDKK